MGRFDKQIKDWATRYKKAVAETGCILLTEKMQQIVQEDYYDQYDPIKYKRTDNFKDNSYEPYLDLSKAMGGVLLSSDNMEEYYQSKGTKDPYNKNLIFELDMEGYHGAAQRTSPFNSIKQFSESAEFLSQVQSVALVQAGNIF